MSSSGSLGPPVGARGPADPPAVLLVTGRGDLVEHVGRLAAAAAVPARVAARVEEAAAEWARAPLVLLGDDAAALGVPARRPGVVLLAPEGSDERVWRRALEVGAEAVLVLPADEHDLLARLSAAADPPAGRARVVGVMGGSGGVGASVLAAAVATVAAAGRSTLLLDADPLGGGADLLLGAESRAGLRWPDLLAARGALRPALLRAGLPEAASGVRVLAWTPPSARAGSAGPRGVPADDPPVAVAGPAAVEAVVEAAVGAHDLVVADLPRRDDPATLPILWRLDLLVLLVRVELRAVVAATTVRDLVHHHVADVRLLLAPHSGAGLSEVDAVEVLGLPVLGRVGSEAALTADTLRQQAPGSRRRGPLARAAHAVVEAVDDLDHLGHRDHRDHGDHRGAGTPSGSAA